MLADDRYDQGFDLLAEARPPAWLDLTLAPRAPHPLTLPLQHGFGLKPTHDLPQLSRRRLGHRLALGRQHTEGARFNPSSTHG